ncbi:MAG: hypothetical protein IJE49_04710 [Agathobacter sp.]|nr:hypothetical protein [Agathobacter sp.]
MDFNLLSFPLEQIGWGLRQLSLSGAIGNVCAIIIYLLVSFIPCGVFLILKKKGKYQKTDYMLLALSIMLLFVLYYMINPGLLPASMLGSGKVLLGGTFYSLLVAYLVFRIVIQNKTEDLQALQKGLRTVLYIVLVLFAWSAIAECFIHLPLAIKNLQEGNSVAGDSFFYGGPDLTSTYVFLVLQSVVSSLPNGISVVVLYFCIKVLEELLSDLYSPKAILLVKKVTVLCRKSLLVIVAASVLLNIAQLLFADLLYQIHITVNIPIFAILFLLVIHVMARYIEENQKLKQDNDLFI